MSLKHNWNTGEVIKETRESFNVTRIKALLVGHELGNNKLHDYRELADRVTLYFDREVKP